MTAAGFACPLCGAVSHHPEDLRQGYCGRCHAFTGGPDVDVQLRYQSSWAGSASRTPMAWCRLRVWGTHTAEPLAVVTELPDNPGLSVTNAAEHVHAAIQRRYPGARVVEHYPRGEMLPDRCARIVIDDAGRPSWEHVPLDALPRLS